MAWSWKNKRKSKDRARRRAYRNIGTFANFDSRFWRIVKRICRRVGFAKPSQVRKLEYSTTNFRKFEISFCRTARVQRLYDQSFWEKDSNKASEFTPQNELLPERAGYGLADDEQSVSSLASDLPETEGKQYGDLLAALIKAERCRREYAAKIEGAKEKIKPQQGKIDTLLATSKHISRRRKRPNGLNLGKYAGVLDDETRLEASLDAEIQVAFARRNRILKEVHAWENKMYSAVRTLQEGEPRLFRATSGFLANQRWDDPKCDVIPAGLRYDLRKAADCGRSPLRCLSHESSRLPTQRLVEVDDAGNFSLNPYWEMVFREENQRQRMSRLYLEMEEALRVDKPPKLGRSAVSETNGRPAQAESQPGEPDLTDDAELLRQLETAKDELLNSYEYMDKDHPLEYAAQRDAWLATYVYDPILEDTDDDTKVLDYYDRKYIGKDRRANNAFRKAEARYNELRNMVQQRKIMTDCEADMFGLLDHADDGFTESQGTGMMGEYKVRAAVARRKVEYWAPQAEGRVWRPPSEPSVVFEFDTPPPERQPMSQIEPEGPRYHGDLIQRWQAEMAAVREELKPHLREWEWHRQVQLEKAKHVLAARAAAA